ncbi:MAG: citrate (Si)-synthase, partial [Hyphomicrobiales bacterium]
MSSTVSSKKNKGSEKAVTEATLTIGDKVEKLAVRGGSLGPEVIDVSSLYKDTGKFTFDPGFTSTASC